MTLLEFQNGHTDGKCHLIKTLWNKLRKCCFLIKLRRQIIQILYLMVARYLYLMVALVTIYKSFIRPHLDYADVIFDKPSNVTFPNQIRPAQYNAAWAITGTIRGTSKKTLYLELGFEIMKERRWFRRLCCFFLNFWIIKHQLIFTVYFPRQIGIAIHVFQN